MRIAPPSRALPAWAMVVGALLILSVAVLAWLALRPAAQRTTSASQVTPLITQPSVGSTNALTSSAGAGTGAGTGADARAGTATGSAVPEAAAASPAVSTSDALDAPVNPADTAPAVAPGPDASASSGAHGNLQNYGAVSGTVPDLRLDLHVYAPNPADRYAFINMRKVREGDITPEGVQVRQITREGVVLEYHGAEFLLGRQ
jgi:general secretion pathway protein B